VTAAIAPVDKAICTARVRATGGRNGGVARSSGGRLAAGPSVPGSLHPATHREPWFAAVWLACFLSALRIAAGRTKTALPAGTAADADVDLGDAGGAYSLHCGGTARRRQPRWINPPPAP
jgi:lipoyl-dependent peroxiredoxin